MPCRKPEMSKKTRRGAPEISSNPTAAKTRPRQIDRIVFGMSSPPRPTKVAKASSISAKISGEPKLSATEASSGANSGEQNDRDGAADEGGNGRGHQRQAGAALQRQRSPVEGGGDRRRGARYPKRDRTDRAAIHRAVIDRGQKDDRRSRRHQEGDRQQDRHAVHRTQARHRADEQTQRDADDDQQQVDRLQRLQQAAERSSRISMVLVSLPGPVGHLCACISR